MLERFSFKGQDIRMEKREGGLIWVNLTDMAKASKKLVGNWTRLEGTQQLITALEGIMQKRIVEVNAGGSPETTGTWAIEDLAIEFAGWCSIDFKIWMLDKIKTLLKEGNVSLYPTIQVPQTYIEALEAHLKAEKEKEVLKAQLEKEKFLVAVKDSQVKEREKIIEIQTQKIEEQKPKAEFYDIVGDSTGNISVATFSQLICNKFGKEFEVGQNRMFALLRKYKFLKSGSENNKPYQQYLNQGIFKVVNVPYMKGDRQEVHPKTVITPKGQHAAPINFSREDLLTMGIYKAKKTFNRYKFLLSAQDIQKAENWYHAFTGQSIHAA